MYFKEYNYFKQNISSLVKHIKVRFAFFCNFTMSLYMSNISNF